ncbi:NUDIX hydrolase [Flavobacterium noncentrifugens]|uniref:8-oxo-dGTP diphosphatase n=1 Tax=Flavobacterium noncentrifugens TaxID=1128970 RepID=A0A1G9A1P6_9FLAO|nr:NUDIX hydrolase [Flavobacterium noncentrifugens]GEP51743.1 NUDIX hydrolase [Flavobacterium noncentrifugens]SDK21278.1 8-oxo-dGTP diphosphatase [Flavobacterium noncentrifugens]
MRISKIFVTVDVVLIKSTENSQQLLLIQRKKEPFQNFWALPGGFVDENEDLETAALRELSEETGIQISSATQLKAFGKPHRDPRGHMVSVVFFAFADENAVAVAADDAFDAKWFSLNDLPKLAFDHDEIINFALSKINAK